MTVALLDLAAQTTPAQALKTLLTWATIAGLPATAWQPGSVPRALLEGEAVAYADALNLVAAIAKGNVLDLSAGEWLTELARNVYAIERKPAIVARGPALVTNNTGAAFSASAGSLLLASTQSTTAFRVLDAIVGLPDGDTIEVTAQAEAAGLGGNVAVGTITKLITPFPGISVSNPGDGVAWLTQLGAREESDDSLRLRCRARWPQLGGGPTELAYAGWALAIDQVQQAKVQANRDSTGTTKDGQILVVIAGATNPLPIGVVGSVNAYLTPRAGLCVQVNVVAASAVNVPISATLYTTPSTLSTAAAAANDTIRELVASKQIGERLYRAEIVEALMAIVGVGNVVVSSPATDFIPTDMQILSLLTPPSFTVLALP